MLFENLLQLHTNSRLVLLGIRCRRVCLFCVYVHLFNSQCGLVSRKRPSFQAKHNNRSLQISRGAKGHRMRMISQAPPRKTHRLRSCREKVRHFSPDFYTPQCRVCCKVAARSEAGQLSGVLCLSGRTGYRKLLLVALEFRTMLGSAAFQSAHCCGVDVCCGSVRRGCGRFGISSFEKRGSNSSRIAR